MGDQARFGHNPGERGAWVRRRYAVIDGAIVPVTQDPPREFDPFFPVSEWDESFILHDSGPRLAGLFSEPEDILCLTVKLGNTNVGDLREVERFVSAFGPLGCGLDGVTWNWDAYTEDIAEFAQAATAFQATVRLYAKWEQTGEDAVAGEWLETMRGYLAQAHRVPTYASSRNLEEMESLRPPHAVVNPGFKRWNSCWGFPTLLVACYLDLFDHVEAGRGPRECANPTCRRIFIPIRDDRRYCRVACSSAVRQRQKRQALRTRGTPEAE